jgi:hypothetical protein
LAQFHEGDLSHTEEQFLRVETVAEANIVLEEAGMRGVVQCARMRYGGSEWVRRKARAEVGEIILDIFVPQSTSAEDFDKMSAIIDEAIKTQRFKVAGQFPTAFDDENVFDMLVGFTTSASSPSPPTNDGDAAAVTTNLGQYGIIIGIVFLSFLFVVAVVVLIMKVRTEKAATATIGYNFAGMGGRSTLKGGGSSLVFQQQYYDDDGGYLSMGGHPALSMHSVGYMDTVPNRPVAFHPGTSALLNEMEQWENEGGNYSSPSPSTRGRKQDSHYMGGNFRGGFDPNTRDRFLGDGSHSFGGGSRRQPPAPRSVAPRTSPTNTDGYADDGFNMPSTHYYPG